MTLQRMLMRLEKAATPRAKRYWSNSIRSYMVDCLHEAHDLGLVANLPGDSDWTLHDLLVSEGLCQNGHT